MKKSKIGMGIGLGAGIVGLVGAGAGLVMAYNDAKKHDKKLSDMITRKRRENEFVHNCDCCSCESDTCNCHNYEYDEDVEQLTIDDIDEVVIAEETEKELFAEEIEVEETPSIDELKEQLNFYKNEIKRIKKEIANIKYATPEDDTDLESEA